MPRSVLLRPLGGLTGKTRKRYALFQKIMLVEESDRLRVEQNLSIRRAGEVLGVPFQLLSKWGKEVARLRAASQAKRQAHNRKAVIDGPASQLGSIEDELLQFIFAKREQGVNVRHTLVACRASGILRETFGKKSFNAKLKSVARFMKKHNYVYRRVTNEAQKSLKEVSDEAKAFLEEARLLLVGPHRDMRWIFNMDQTPLHFSYQSSRTLEKRGKKTINVRKSSSQTKRATAALTVTAAGDFLTPMIIFKGRPNGHIVNRELPTLDPTSIYACQDAAWMDERCMLIWVDEVLGAYLVANPPPEGVQPVLLLDSYRCHMMASVVSRIEAMGVHVIHISGGCTGMTQPLDVGINRSFKARCRRMWEEWLVDLLDTTNEVRDATREEVSEWTAAVFWELVGSRILRNSWRKTGFDWFPGVVDPDDIVDGGEGGNDSNGDDDGFDDDDKYTSDDSLFDDNDEEGGESEDDEDSEEEGDNNE